MYKICTNFSNKYYFVELREILIPSLIKLCTSPRRARGTRVVNLRNNAWRHGWSLIKTLPIQDPRLTKFHVFRVHRYLDRVCQPRSIAPVDAARNSPEEKPPCGSLFLWIVSKSRTTAYILVLADSRLLQEQVARGCENGRFPRAILAYLPRIFHIISYLRHATWKETKRADPGSRSGRPKEKVRVRRKWLRRGTQGSALIFARDRGSQRPTTTLLLWNGISRAISSNLRSLRPREFDHEIRYLVYL